MPKKSHSNLVKYISIGSVFAPLALTAIYAGFAEIFISEILLENRSSIVIIQLIFTLFLVLYLAQKHKLQLQSVGPFFGIFLLIFAPLYLSTFVVVPSLYTHVIGSQEKRIVIIDYAAEAPQKGLFRHPSLHVEGQPIFNKSIRLKDKDWWQNIDSRFDNTYRFKCELGIHGKSSSLGFIPQKIGPLPKSSGSLPTC